MILNRWRYILIDRTWLIVFLQCLFSELDKQSDVHSTEWVSAYRRKHQAPVSGLFFGSGFCTCVFPRQHGKAIWLFSQHIWQTGIWCGHVFGLPWYRKACYKNGKIMLCIFSLLDFFNRAAHLLFHTQESVYFYLGFIWVRTIVCEQVYLNVWIWRLSKTECGMEEIFFAIGRKWSGVYVNFVLLGWISLWRKPSSSKIVSAESDLPILLLRFLLCSFCASAMLC